MGSLLNTQARMPFRTMHAVCECQWAHRRMLAVPLVEHRIARKLQQIALCGVVEEGKAANAAATLRGAAAARRDLLADAVPLEQVVVARDLSVAQSKGVGTSSIQRMTGDIIEQSQQ